MAYKVGDVIRLPFYLWTAAGAAATDTTAGNYTWPLVKDGVVVSSPSFTITNPSGYLHELAYTIPSAGSYTFGTLTHSTNETDIAQGNFVAESYELSDLVAFLAAPVVPISATANPEAGTAIYIVRGKDISITFRVLQSDGATARDLTGSTFRFALGDRTTTSDASFYNKASISPDSPATNGLVTVTLTDTETAVAAFTSRIGSAIWYELEETTSGSLKYTRGLGRATIVRDIPAAA